MSEPVPPGRHEQRRYEQHRRELLRRLVLLRHGESTANADNTFAGWLDVPLTERGAAQAEAAGRDLAGLCPDAVHTSVLGRAVDTAALLAKAAGWNAPAVPDWRLNERHYGALQGLDRDEARRSYGTERVEAWRRSVDAAPPPATAAHLAAQRADRRYAAHPCARLIAMESLADVALRMAPYWTQVLEPALADGATVVVVSHGNALRVLAHLATGAPLCETAKLKVPTAKPIRPWDPPGLPLAP
jgi:2,3-bisphosphoglycerate-dependent phosphoglycerate mutase